MIRTAPAARIRAFYDTFYRPDRMAVVAVGDTDAAALEASIRRTFDPVRARRETPPPRATTPCHCTRRPSSAWYPTPKCS